MMSRWLKSFVALLLASFATSQESTRRAEENSFEWDLSEFSVRYEKCQYVKMFDDEMAEDEDSPTVLGLKHFVVYKLCPSDACSTCDDDVHGDYVVDVQDFLEATVEYTKQVFEYECANCNDYCGDDNGDNCNGCGKACYQYDNLEANGYVDASDYVQCQQLDGGDDDGVELFIGPRCSKNGNKIVIGLFQDEDCSDPYYDKKVQDVLGMKLSYHILAKIQSQDDSECISCKENQDNQNQNDANDYDDVNEMCENLYLPSGKCESVNGLEGGFVQMNRDNENYENQVENEFMVCTFINSLIWNSYTETGEINIDDEQDVVIRVATPLQKASLSLLILSFAGLAAAAYYLTQQIDKHTPKAELSAQTDKEVI